ncbi:MAG TPA: Flp pilus assembly protein CpaB [Solirubrobacterales bacterium]|nr:Flp pilus assembly protein CpaB [Solirubrobacterales bacterium]
MKPARLAVLGVAILSGGAAALMMGRGAPPPAPPAPVLKAANTSDVLVAAGDLPLGQTLRAGDLRWQPWPAEAVPPGASVRLMRPGAVEDIAGSMVRSAFLAGEPIRRERLIKANGSGFMSAILPSGMRAVAISIDTRGASSAGGFIQPKDRVDVLRTASGGEEQLTDTILSNIRVLAIGQNIQERNGEKVVTGETATLELTPGQAEEVILAQKTGQLSLALRSLADAQQVEMREERESVLTIVRYGVPKQAAKP